MSITNKDFYEDIRSTMMLYKIMGLTSLKNVFYGRIDFQWGTNLIWPLVCTIKHVINRYTLANTIVRIIIY